MTQVFNFSAGPAMLPVDVMRQAQQELCDWQGSGSSVMEISHRSKAFIRLAEESEKDLRDLLNIPDNYRVLFFHGGARMQHAAIPLNLLKNHNDADYICGGYWSQCAAVEAEKYCTPNTINVLYEQEQGKRAIKPMSEWQLNDNTAYVHYCPNETIDGIAIDETPNFNNKIIVADYSSAILSRPIDVSKFGLIYAGAQKNIGPSGITVLIIREDLIGHARKETPSVIDYKVQADRDSMFNTPATFPWYMAALVFKWLKAQGGLEVIAKRNQEKAHLLYSAIDKSDFYINGITDANRSWMNVPFYLSDSKLDSLFLQESELAGLRGLKGHKVAGGMRASIYNAMPLEGVQALVSFMADFERKYG